MTKFLSDICRWLVGEEDVEVVGGATTNHHHWPLTKATAIAQPSAIVGQGGLSNLQRFKAHHPPTFKG